MDIDEPSAGPLQLLLIGFETTERFRGEVAREIATLRGRGLLRVMDARLLLRTGEGKLTEVDLNPMLADPSPGGNPLAHLLGTNGGGNGGITPQEAFHRTAGFALDDLRRVTDEIAPGEHALALLVEHVWASGLRESVLRAGGRLVAQGFLTPEVTMLIGAEIQVRAEAQTAIELAAAARGAALLDALSTIAARDSASAEETVGAAAEVVGVLVDQGFVHATEAGDAVAALATAGVLESALVEAAVAEAEDLLGEG